MVSEALAEIYELQLWVTPCDDQLSLVMGYAAGRPKSDAVRGANHRLNRLRRAIEVNHRP